MSYQDADKVRRLVVGNAAAKSVLRCLADCCNSETGQCNPSIDTISRETELNRKTVYKAIAYLEEKGFVRRERIVLNSSNNYVLNIDSDSRDTKNGTCPKNGSTKIGSTKNGTSPKNGLSVGPNMGRVVGPNLGHESVNESVKESVNNSIGSAPNFSLTSPEKTTISKKETVEPKPKREAKVQRRQKPEELTDEFWQDFLAYRKQKKAPVTERVVSLLRKEAKTAGWKLEEVINEMMVRNWTGFKADWVKDEWKDPNAHWVSASEYNKELPPVTYSTGARSKFVEKLHAGMSAYDIKDLPNNEEQR